jgi:3'(2'), 5'-bisphosphate nucleotidase
MTQPYATELHVAIAAVRAAATVCQAVQRDLVNAQTLAKKDRSPVTVADFASQAVVCAMLETALPGDPVVGEEATGQLRQADQQHAAELVRRHVAAGLQRDVATEPVLNWIDRGSHAADADRYWTLDPIDGTKGFLRAEQYAVALALIEHGQVVLGVLGCPNLPRCHGTGVLMTAVRGQGARMMPLEDGQCDGRMIRVSDVADPTQARFCESVESGHSDQDHAARIAQRLGITQSPLRMDSQCKYAAVARGDAQIYLRMPTRADYREKIWDHAAGMLVVEEAGGRVSDIDGKPLDFSRGRTLEHNRGIIATCGPIHDAVLNAVAAAAT